VVSSEPSANSRRRDASRHVSESVCDANGRQDGGHGMLGKAHRRRTISGFAINCAHLGCPSLVPQSGLFMCPCHGRCVLPRWVTRLWPPERGLFEYPHKIQDGWVSIQAGELPTPERAHPSRKKRDALIAQIGEWLTGDCSLPRPSVKLPSIPCRRHGQLGGMCLEAPPSSGSFCNRHRNHAGIHLCPVGQRGVEQFAEFESRRDFGWFIRALQDGARTSWWPLSSFT